MNFRFVNLLLSTQTACHNFSGQRGAESSGTQVPANERLIAENFIGQRCDQWRNVWKFIFLTFFSAWMPEHNSDVLFRQSSLLICSFALRSNIPNHFVWHSGMIWRSFVSVKCNLYGTCSVRLLICPWPKHNRNWCATQIVYFASLIGPRQVWFWQWFCYRSRAPVPRICSNRFQKAPSVSSCS